MAILYKLYLTSSPSVFYVGSSVELPKRFKRHLRELRKKIHHCIKLQEAFNCCNVKELKFEVVGEFSENDRYLAEYNLINKLPKTYNTFVGKNKFGDSISAHPNRDKIISKISKSVKDRYKNMSQEDKEKLSLNNRGSNNNNWKGGRTFCRCGNRIGSYSKTCDKCRNRTGVCNPFYGKKHSEETKAKLAAKNKGKKPVNSKKVYAKGKVYLSATDAAKSLNCAIATICNRVKNDKFKDYYWINA